MIKYLLKRIANWILLIFLATNLTYFLANGFLHPRSNYENTEKLHQITPEQVDRQLDLYNLNDHVNIFERWAIWLKNIALHWDWGYSPAGQWVNQQVGFRIWVSAELMLGGTILATLIGICVGVYTASRQYKFGDRAWQAISILAMNIHPAVAALLVVLLGISVNHLVQNLVHDPSFILLYVTGAKSDNVHGFFPTLLDALQHLALPTLSLTLIGYAGTHFTQRTLLLDNIAADYVRTARAKGLTKAQAIRKHALRTSLIPIAVSFAYSIPGVFLGALISENIFGWQGMGAYFVQAMGKNDIHGVVAVSAFGAAATAVGAILADIILVYLDPRVRVS